MEIELNLHKTQIYFEVLLFTGDKALVEASPYDTIWGIGLGEEEAVNLPETAWRGTNWLGEVLTDLKTDLREKYTLTVRYNLSTSA